MFPEAVESSHDGDYSEECVKELCLLEQTVGIKQRVSMEFAPGLPPSICRRYQIS